MTAESEQLFNSALKDLLTSGEYSDFTITCENRSWKVHKAIICPRSGYFERAVKFGREAEDKGIDLVEDEAQIVEMMLEYLYSGDYTLPNSNDPSYKSMFPHTCPPSVSNSSTSYIQGYSLGPGPVSPLAPNNPFTTPTFICPHHSCSGNYRNDEDDDYIHRSLQLLNLTPTTRPRGLHTVSANRRRREAPDPIQTFSGNWTASLPLVRWRCDTCADLRPIHLVYHAKLYELADKYHVQGLKPLILERFKAACQLLWNSDQFPVAAEVVFATTPEDDKGLRNLVVDTISEHLEIMKKPEIEPLMITYNGLAFALLKMKVETNGWK
ncbi:hypothetical protein BDV96DRAFT_168387 [Lophiotrema nucula]|uniref:BTB domain-containing protein n=1 Tax=Lophiotrema nucula TaxID=690887 RepID=A0A6A5YZR7_9PLEO|nr:hypothetical protein BDV96DRAFT_168387 [Lophiotrema nucula]